MTADNRKDEIRDAQIRLLISTNRLIDQAERVKQDRDRLMALAGAPSEEGATDARD